MQSNEYSMNKTKLSCEICTKYEYCEIIERILELEKTIEDRENVLKEKDYIQNSLITYLPSFQIKKRKMIYIEKELNNLRIKQQKCFNSRRYLHKHKPEYILFKDEKYDHRFDDDPEFLYFYCNRWKEYLLYIHPQTNIEEELNHETM